jgi:cell division protein FtsB
MEIRRVPKKKRNKKKLLVNMVTLIFMVWAALTFADMRGQITQKRLEGDEIESALTAQRIRNATLTEGTDSDDIEAMYARIARDKLGLVTPEEIIIVNRMP